MLDAKKIKSLADDLIKKYKTNDPEFLADLLGIKLYYRADFKDLLGFYSIVNNLHCIFIKKDLELPIQRTVIAHELGHHFLHDIIVESGGFHDTGIFNINGSVEYEANAFAAQLLIPDDFLLDKIALNYEVVDIANELSVMPNLIEIKIKEMIRLGNKNFRYVPSKLNFLENFSSESI